MDVASRVSPAAVGAGAPGWAEAAHAAAEAAPGTCTATWAAAPGTGTSAPAPVAGSRADSGHEAATLQTFARPHAPVLDPLRPTDSALPAAAHAGSEFAMPTDQLVPAALIGLQVEPGWAWPLPRPRIDAPAAEASHPPAAAAAETAIDHEGEPPAQDRAGDDEAPSHDDPPAIGELGLDDPRHADWCEPLTHALREALRHRPPPQALLDAADQWRRGRCVVLACPQGADPAGPAWAFVLWPRTRAAAISRLALCGLRVDARLHWASLPPAAAWRQVRVVKDHQPRFGRQLITLDDGAAGNGSVPCEIQLGPVLARSLRRCEVCLRIDAARRFWKALGAQWSARVLVCARPLVAPRTLDIVEAAC